MRLRRCLLLLADPAHRHRSLELPLRRRGSADGGAVSVDFPTAPHLSAASWADAPLEILAEAPAAPVTVTGETLSFDLVVRFAGVLPGPRAPYSRWSILLSKPGELPTGYVPPAVLPDATSLLSATRASLRTPWEEAAARAIGSEDLVQASPERRRELLRSFRLRSDALDLAACVLDTNQIDALGRFATPEAWGASADPAAEPVLSPPLRDRVAGAFLSSELTAALTLELTPSVRARWIPCDATFTSADTGSTCVAGSRYRLGRVDFVATGLGGSNFHRDHRDQGTTPVGPPSVVRSSPWSWALRRGWWGIAADVAGTA